MTIGRRAALGLIGAGAASPAAAMLPRSNAVAIVFRHGVASGDPTPHGAILWTRVSHGDAAATTPVELEWRVVEADGTKLVETGRIEAHAARDFTAKAEPKKLQPGRDYLYWFEADSMRSPVGRFRTLPLGATPDVVLAVVSCQLYPGGLFNAYDAIAKLDRLDAIVHLGDYIYEYGREGYGAETADKLGRHVDPPHEIVTLADYRRRHAQYKTDPDLQAAHARAAMIAVWDDHETSNDSWTGGAANHQPASEGDWAKRKAAAMQAYFEWMPIRDAAPGQPWDAINRSFQFGDLASLMMVETRLLARSLQAGFKSAAPAASALPAIVAERNQPDREMLGTNQQRWLAEQLASSVAAGRPWQILGNQVIMGRVAGPLLSDEIVAGLPEAMRPQVAVAQASYKAGLPFNLDAWDGYPAARERLYAGFRAAGSRPLVLSGDSHAFWANDLADASGTLVAAEFGTSSISSPSIGDSLPGFPLGKVLEDASPEVLLCDQRAKGFILLTLTSETARADYRSVSTILVKPYGSATLAVFEVAADREHGGLRRA